MRAKARDYKDASLGSRGLQPAFCPPLTNVASLEAATPIRGFHQSAKSDLSVPAQRFRRCTSAVFLKRTGEAADQRGSVHIPRRHAGHDGLQRAAKGESGQLE